MAPQDQLSHTFAAIADPIRRAIRACLTCGEASATELAAPFDITLPIISRHLKVLERTGLIERSRDAQWRHCRLQAARLRDVADWTGHYRRFWEESFDRLNIYLEELQGGKKDDHKIGPPQNQQGRSSLSPASSTRHGRSSGGHGQNPNSSRSGGTKGIHLTRRRERLPRWWKVFLLHAQPGGPGLLLHRRLP